MKIKLLAILLATGLFPWNSANCATGRRPATASSARNEAEKWVIEQINAGETADLEDEFGDDLKKRQIHAAFLQDLLTGAIPGVTPRRQRIRISGAVVAEPIDLESAEMVNEIWLDDCQFKQNVSFARSIFKGNLSLEGSTFSANADFDGMKVGGIAFFDGAVFTGPLDLSNASVGGEFAAPEGRFQDKDTGVNCDGFKVGGSAIFDKAIFAGPVEFGGAEISGELSASAAQFQNTEKSANFGGVKVGYMLFLENAIFAGPATFDAAEITGEFKADQAEFRNTATGVSFNGMKVKSEAIFKQATFAGPADFRGADIQDQFTVEEASFQNPSAEVTFNGMKVRSFAFFRKAVFNGPVDFRCAVFGNQLIAEEAQFLSKSGGVTFNSMKAESLITFYKALFAGPVFFDFAEIGSQFVAREARFQESASFNSMKVGSTAFFFQTVFAGPVDFSGAEIAGEFYAAEARFDNKDHTANFEGLKAGGTASFQKVVFAGNVNLADASFLDLIISDSPPGSAPIPKLDLSRTSIKRNLSMWQLNIRDLVAPMLHVEGPTLFKQVKIEHSADLRYDDFATLDVTQSQWPTRESRNLQLQGTNYKFIRAAMDERDSHEALLKLVDQSAYTADVYGNLEAFLTRQGYTDDANRAYVAGRSRERNDNINWHSFHPLSYAWDLLLQGIGYGRYPERAVYVCILVVAFGCWVFKPARMEPQKNEDGARQKSFNRFWYSLELFLPLVELRAIDAWEPKAEYGFLRNYMRIHTLLGWVLIPIALGSVTGLIK